MNIPKFDGDYEHWAMLMENLLRSKEWWEFVETGVKQPEAGVILTGAQRSEQAELKLKDLKVKNYLFASIDKTILKTIAKKETSKDIWESMKVKYQGNKRVKSAQLQRLRRNFEVLEMKEGDSITEYFSRVMVVANDMRNLGEDMPDDKIVEKILRTLVERFTYIVCAIEESKDIKELTVDELQSSLLVHEQNLSKHTGDELALRMEGGRGMGGYAQRGGNRGGRGGYGRGRPTLDKSKIECYKCHKLGHFKNFKTNVQAGRGVLTMLSWRKMCCSWRIRLWRLRKYGIWTQDAATICAESWSGSLIWTTSFVNKSNLETTRRCWWKAEET